MFRILRHALLAVLALFLFSTPVLRAGEQKGSGAEWATVPAEGLVKVGSQAPAFPARSRWYGGDAVTLESLRGKVVLLYFLIPECGSCDAFAPHLKRLAIMKRKDLAIVGISWASRRELGKYLRKRLGKYPILQDPRRAYSNRYIGQVVKFPYLALLDKEGKLAWFGRGKFHAQVTREIDRLLGKGVPTPERVPAKIHALVFGNDKSRMNVTLSCPKGDIAAVAEALRKRQGEVTVLSPGGAEDQLPTVARVKETVARMAEAAGETDALLLYYSGDGEPLNPGVQKADLRLQLADGTLTLTELREMLGQSKATSRLVFVDVGHDDNYSVALQDIAAELETQLPDLPVLLSAARYDKSTILYKADGRRTLFRDLLVKQLNTAWSPYELFRTLRDGMSEYSRNNKRLQTPFLLSRKSSFSEWKLPAVTAEAPAEKKENSD